MSLLRRAKRVAQSEGVFILIKRAVIYIYRNHIRPIVPYTGYYYKNNIRWKKKKPTDKLIDPVWRNDPEHEMALISSVREHVQSGDHVGVIGGGYGISTAAAAKKTGPSGSVTAYEASSDRIVWMNRTASLNNLNHAIDVNHALVGPDVQVYGKKGSVAKIQPAELPEFDVLEMDCEGAEQDILENLGQRPRIIIVEVHPVEVSEQEIKDILSDMGYKIINRDLENKNSNNPLPVLTAKHQTVSHQEY